MIDSAHRLPFREYLRLQGAQVKNPPQDEEYDALILKVWEFFSLRVSAEDYFAKHRYVAKTAKGALPLPWREIQAVFSQSGPPETALTLIAKHHFGTIAALIGNVRKVLARERSKVAIGRVQQVDPHCLRWLTRQPGYSAVEKAGARQEILGIVRRENFDTLENRVLKDFLKRCLALASVYLHRNDKVEWKEEATIIAVKRLKALCIGALEMPVFEKVKAISGLPHPNYVLQQDRLYSQIWREYLKILREEDVAERMWNRREEVDDIHKRLHDGVELHCSPFAKFDTPIWFNDLDGQNPIAENPIWENELLPTPVEEPKGTENEVVPIDLTFPWDGRDTLVLPDGHPNARPFIQNPHRPSLEPGKPLRLEQILENRDVEHLADYFSHLHGILGGKRWIVLVPDHWEASWLERVIRARPSAFVSRSDFFLLWRSVAAALEYADSDKCRVGDELVVKDGYKKNRYNGILIRYKDDGDGRAVPQRASTRLHGSDATNNERRFCLECDAKHLSPIQALSRGRRICLIGKIRADDGFLASGVRRFLDAEVRGIVPYYDELDALSMVVVDGNEEVFFDTLVKHEECHKGGKKKVGERRSPGHLTRGEKILRIYLAEGIPSKDMKLNEKIVEFEMVASKDEDVFCQAEIIPGQGLATVHVSAAFLERPLLLDLQTMAPSEMTLVRIERELKRHFPPTMPYVEASPELWKEGKSNGMSIPVCECVSRYLNEGILPDKKAFALAQPYWGDVGEGTFRQCGVERYFDDETMSPVDKFKRENVFGNADNHRFPANADWNLLFSRLENDYKKDPNVLTLIAWTYQTDSKYFEGIRSDLYRRYVLEGQILKPQEITFCANNFSADDIRTAELLRAAFQRIVAHSYSSDDLRLSYNIMQFNKLVLSKIPSPICFETFKTLCHDFSENLFFESTLFGKRLKYSRRQCSVIAAPYLRCLLFILNRRRFDKDFIRIKKEWIPKGFLGESLTFISRNQEQLRKTLIEYVNGRGTLEGIPSN